MRQSPRVIFSTGSLYVMDIARCFELAAGAGFDGIEIMCDDRWSTRDPTYLSALSDRHGLPILAVHTPFSPTLPGWPNPSDQVERIRQSLRLAETLGAEVLIVHVPLRVGLLVLVTGRGRMVLPWRTPCGPVKRWVEQDLPAVQSGTTVKIGLENMPAQRVLGVLINPAWWNTVETWSRLHDHLTLDTTHWATHGIDPLEAYAAAGPRVCHVHLSNYDGREHRLPQEGHYDLAALLRALAADAYSGAVCVELQPDALHFDDDATLRRHLRDCVAFCRAHL